MTAENSVIQARPEAVAKKIVDPTKDPNFARVLQENGYLLELVHLNNQEKNPALKGPAIDFRIWQINAQVTYSGYRVDPKIKADLEARGFKKSKILNTAVSVFNFSSQWKEAPGIGVVKVFPDLEIIATSAPDAPIEKIGNAVLNGMYGNEWRENKENIRKAVKKSGVDCNLVIHILTNLFGRAAMPTKIPRQTWRRGKERLVYIPPNIVFNSNYEQVPMNGSNESMHYSAKKIQKLLIDLLGSS